LSFVGDKKYFIRYAHGVWPQSCAEFSTEFHGVYTLGNFVLT
jgi:hypothetical protein